MDVLAANIKEVKACVSDTISSHQCIENVDSPISSKHRVQKGVCDVFHVVASTHIESVDGTDPLESHPHALCTKR